MVYLNLKDLSEEAKVLANNVATLSNDIRAAAKSYEWMCEREDIRNMHDSAAIENLRLLVQAAPEESLTEAVERLVQERDKYRNELAEIRERLLASLGGAT